MTTSCSDAMYPILQIVHCRFYLFKRRLKRHSGTGHIDPLEALSRCSENRAAVKP